MDNNAVIILSNGLGDKMLDLIGFFIICKYLNYMPNFMFDTIQYFAWGNSNYDINLFDFNHVRISLHKDFPFYVNSPNPSSSLCPFKVFSFLKSFLPEITFQQISRDFSLYAKQMIQPSKIILQNIPSNIENAYGIHLRKTDKINDNSDTRHVNTTQEFDIIIRHLLSDVRNIILYEKDPIFLVVSEDLNWRLTFIDIMHFFAGFYNKKIQILQVDYDIHDSFSNFNSVLDMFCLSRCKEILQGVKYSTFSILASILGNMKIRNYSVFTDSYDTCLIHVWSSVIEINSCQNFDLHFHHTITSSVENIDTNIRQIFFSEN
jgi:hypothetical protein